MPTFIPPYTVTVNSTHGGQSQCSYVDGNNAPVPPNTVLTTTTPKGDEGELPINFIEAKVEGKHLRLVGAAVKTVGNDPTMSPYNYLPATRTLTDIGWVDGVTVPWSADTYTTRGAVLLFAQVNDVGDMINFYPSADPQTKNDNPDAGS